MADAVNLLVKAARQARREGMTRKQFEALADVYWTTVERQEEIYRELRCDD